MEGSGPGVPEALPRTLRFVAERLGADSLERIWLFPPMIRGRREWGLVAVARGTPHGEPSGRHRLYTARYAAERTGEGLTVAPELVEEGEAPPDRLPGIMEGVVQRSEMELGDPREVELRGDPETFRVLVEELEEAVPEVEVQ